MASIYNKPPSGWNPWVPVIVKKNNYFPGDGPFPSVYAPTQSFWVKSQYNTCNVSFNVYNPAPLQGSPTGGSLVGAIGAINSTINLLSKPTSVIYSEFFNDYKKYPGMTMGYTISSKFKQNVYCKLSISYPVGPVFVSEMMRVDSLIEIIQNYRFKRMYIVYGEVVSFYKDELANNILVIDYTKDMPRENTVISGSVKIYGSDGQAHTFKIIGINKNFGLILEIPDDNEYIPITGDFYEITSNPLCADDPYLIGGFYYGTEDEMINSQLGYGVNSSGYDLYVTSQNKPYMEGEILGVYIWKNIGQQNSENQTITTTSTTTEAFVSQPSTGSSMANSGDYGWTFVSFGGTSDIYPNEKRYVQNSDGVYVEMETSSTADITDLLNQEETTYLRVEISKGGSSYLQNFYSSCLKGSYIKISNKLYKIIAHVEANIIDVSLFDAKDKTKISISSGIKYSILNQNAWMINEHYERTPAGMQEFLTGEIISVTDTTGITNGIGTSLQATEVKIKVKATSAQTLFERGFSDLEKTSFFKRFTTTLTASNQLENVYDKYYGWYLSKSYQFGKYDDYKILYIETIEPETYNDYEITVYISGGLEDLLVGDTTSVYFGVPFETVQPYARNLLYLDISGIPQRTQDAGGADILFDRMCISGEYVGPPYKISVSQNERVATFDNHFFGIDSDGSSTQMNALRLLISTQRGTTGISSFFDKLVNKGSVFYLDPVFGIITIRKGALNYTETPEKMGVFVGSKRIEESHATSSTIELNEAYGYLDRITFDPQTNITPENNTITFSIGDLNNKFGFYVSGEGSYNLRDANLLLQPTNFNSTTGFNVSPVYKYAFDNSEVTFGIITKNEILVTNVDNETGLSFINPKLKYVQLNQGLNNLDNFDVHELNSGKVIMLYDRSIINFKIDSDEIDVSKWINTKCIFIIGSTSQTYIWGRPNSDKYIETTDGDDNQYPILLLNSVEYLTSIYDNLSNNIYIFCKSYLNENNPSMTFLGCYIVNVNRLYVEEDIKEATYEGYSLDSSQNFPTKFNYRIARLNDQLWTSEETLENMDGLLSTTTIDYDEDFFVKIMGPASTESQIVNENNFGFVSSFESNDGLKMIFYDGVDGVSVLFSNDSCKNWYKSNFVFVRDAKAGVRIGDFLFYIDDSGIGVLITSEYHFTNSANISREIINAEGNTITELEVLQQELQDEIGSLEKIIIGSGDLNFQKITGYVDSTGRYKIFFYTKNNALKSMESYGGRIWRVSDNF